MSTKAAMRSPRAVMSLFLGAALFGCATVKSMTVSRPTVTFRDARVDRIDFVGADVTLLYEIENPNAAALHLINVSYSLDVDGHPLVAGHPPNGFAFPPGRSELSFPVRLAWLEVLPALSALATTDVVHYRASGTVGIDTVLGPLTLDVAHEGTIPTPKLPQIAIDSPRLTSLSPLGARIVIPLKVANPNGFPLPLVSIAGELRIAGQPVGQLALPPQGMVQAQTERTVMVPLDLSFLSAGVAVARALQEGQAEITLEGSIAVGPGATLPVHHSQIVTIKRQQ
jgi:LEA14-like dessication related protein